MRNGSYYRFHRCLRNEFFEIGAIDHIIDRAGITENEAMEIEEKNVEKQSLYPIFPKGLNMIPGGKAGFKFLHEYAKRTGYKIEKNIYLCGKYITMATRVFHWSQEIVENC